MSPTELRDQAYSVILGDFTAASRDVNAKAALPYVRTALGNLQSAAMDGHCAPITAQQRDNLIGAYMAALKNIASTIDDTHQSKAIHAWCRGPVGIILFWHDMQSVDPAVVADVVSLSSAFTNLVSSIEGLDEMLARHRETPGVMSFIERAVQEHRFTHPLSN